MLVCCRLPPTHGRPIGRISPRGIMNSPKILWWYGLHGTGNSVLR